MSHRDPHVWLDPAEARCSPAASPQCGRFSCGRYLAPIPAAGGKVADFNHDRTAYSGTCQHWISSELKRPAPVVTRPVFKSLGGA